MDFLAPIFAAVGLAAAAVPFVLHMLRRAPTQNMPFSVVRFLKPARPKLTKRSTIEHWPLMLLRILALVLIGLAFARPYHRTAVTEEPGSDAIQHVALLIDRSASMRRDGIRDGVARIVRETVAELSDDDLLSVFEFSKNFTSRISPQQWAKASAGERSSLVDEVLTSWQPDWLPTHTAAALRRVADELAQENQPGSAARKRRLVLITDFQEGSELDALQNSSWPASVQLDLRIVNPRQPGNVGISWFKDSRTDRIRVRLTSAGDSAATEFLLQPYDDNKAPVGKPIPVTVNPGQRSTVLLPKADEATARVVAGVELVGDPQPFDNFVDLPTTQNPVIRVAIIGSTDRNDPETMGYYLQRALDGITDQRVELTDIVRDDGVVLPIAPDVRLAVVTDSVPVGLNSSLQEFLGRGGVLLVALKSVDMAGTLSAVLPDQLSVAEADVPDYAMFGQVDFESPLFAAFSDAKFSDFSSIRFWRYRRLRLPVDERQPGAWNVVAKFDSGDPAIVSTVSGGGRVILLASGWQPEDSQWALSTRFPPLISSVLAMSDPGRSDELARTVGDTVHPADLVASNMWTMRLPGGETVGPEDLTSGEDASSLSDNPAAPSTKAGAFELAEPGRYVITGMHPDTGESTAVTVLAALDPSESRTEALPSGQLQVLGVTSDNLESDVAPDQTTGDNISPGQLSVSELERRQKWWRWFLLAGLGCLMLESILAAFIESRREESLLATMAPGTNDDRNNP
ncbi:MAG: BatA domain-containing protein [Planctomycetaceae bacterium]